VACSKLAGYPADDACRRFVLAHPPVLAQSLANGGGATVSLAVFLPGMISTSFIIAGGLKNDLNNLFGRRVAEAISEMERGLLLANGVGLATLSISEKTIFFIFMSSRRSQ
jgi:hypothetical protein